MTRLSNEQIMDFLDGTLSPEEMARIESHLDSNNEDRELVEELRFATQSLHDFNVAEYGAEPMRVSENFWPELRENLGPAPKRSFFRSLVKSLNGAGAAKPTVRYSFGAAFAALVLALGMLMFAPKNAQQPALAGMSPADKTFIQQSLKQHESYVQAAPVAGDVDAVETSSDEGDDDAGPQ
jgi:anti-sigma factor RsiW